MTFSGLARAAWRRLIPVGLRHRFWGAVGRLRRSEPKPRDVLGSPLRLPQAAWRLLVPVKLRHGFWSLTGRVRRAVPNNRHVLASLSWKKADGYRHLLALSPRELGMRQQVQRAALNLLLALPDRQYRRRFARYGQALARIPPADVGPAAAGITSIIGTLGPGGAERQAALTLRGLASRGYGPIRLICIFLDQEWQRFFLGEVEAAGVAVRTMPTDRSIASGPSAAQLADAVRELGPSLGDVASYVEALSADRPLLGHFWLDECSIKGGLAAVAVGIPRVVLGLRSLPPCNFLLHQPYMREAYRWLARQPGVQLVNNSVAGARAYEAWLGLNAGAIRVVHNGFVFDEAVIARHRAARHNCRAQLGVSSESPVVGTVMRLSEEKRPFLWLDIAARVHQQVPAAHFLIVGDGVLRTELEVRIASMGLAGFVHSIGHKRDALSWISAMDLFLLTSRVEGLPNVLVEAQAMGVPVVTTNAGGAVETVRHGRTGWVLTSDDGQQAADLLMRLLRDEAWRSTAATEARAFVEEAFGVERMLNETLATYGADLDLRSNWGGK